MNFVADNYVEFEQRINGYGKMSLRYERNLSGNHSSGSSLWSSPSPLLHATVPFSWEQQPGIPKNKGSSVRATRSNLSINFGGENHDELRPPPLFSRPSEAVGNYQSARPRPKSKKVAQVETGPKGDPFMAALLECTKQQTDPKNSIKASEGNTNNKKKSKNSTWFQFPSIFSCTGSSCSTSNRHISLPVAKPVKSMKQDTTLSDLIRRAKGKMFAEQVSDVPETNHSNFWAQKQSELMNNPSPGLAIEPADLQIKRPSTMPPRG